MIVVPSDFIGEITIAQVGGTVGGVSSTVQGFIDKYEPKFLKELLGTTLYNQLIAGLEENPIESKWTDLSEFVKPMIANYVYFFYIRNQTTSTAGMSEVKGKIDNGTAVNSVYKQERAWNEMAEMARDFNLDLSIYPFYVKPYIWCRSEIYFNIGV